MSIAQRFPGLAFGLMVLLSACGGRVEKALVAVAPEEGEVRPANADRQFKSARFSPDGTFIAFHALDANTKEVVGFMRPDGAEQKVLADPQTALASVAWSPDGKTLYFTSTTGIQAADPTSGTITKVADAVDATDLDVSEDGTALLWVKNGSTLQSLRRNVAGATPVVESHQGTSPRFDSNGAVPGYVYVASTANGHPLQRDILGTKGPSGGVTLDLGPLASVSVLGADHYVVSSAAGIERVAQDGTRAVLRTGTGLGHVDATRDGKWVLYLQSDSPNVFVMASP